MATLKGPSKNSLLYVILLQKINSQYIRPDMHSLQQNNTENGSSILFLRKYCDIIEQTINWSTKTGGGIVGFSGFSLHFIVVYCIWAAWAIRLSKNVLHCLSVCRLMNWAVSRMANIVVEPISYRAMNRTTPSTSVVAHSARCATASPVQQDLSILMDAWLFNSSNLCSLCKCAMITCC